MSWIDTRSGGSVHQSGKDLERRDKQRDEELSETIALWMQKDFEPPYGVLVTLIRAWMDRDFEHAYAEVSILPESQAEKALAALRELSHDVRRYLAKAHPEWRYHPTVSWRQADQTEVDL